MKAWDFRNFDLKRLLFLVFMCGMLFVGICTAFGCTSAERVKIASVSSAKAAEAAADQVMDRVLDAIDGIPESQGTDMGTSVVIETAQALVLMAAYLSRKKWLPINMKGKR